MFVPSNVMSLLQRHQQFACTTTHNVPVFADLKDYEKYGLIINNGTQLSTTLISDIEGAQLSTTLISDIEGNSCPQH